MKKSMWTAACAMLVLAGCSSSSSASSTASTASTSSSTTSASSTAAASGDTFTVGMECNYAPFNWQTTDATESSAELPNGAGYCDGYDVKISQDLADKLGKQLVVKKINWDGLQPALESGEIDAIVAGMTANDEREEGIDFTTPYYSSDMVMIVPKDSDVASFTRIQDLYCN